MTGINQWTLNKEHCNTIQTSYSIFHSYFHSFFLSIAKQTTNELIRNTKLQWINNNQTIEWHKDSECSLCTGKKNDELMQMISE